VQALTASPRESFTTAQITALLTAPDMSVDFGVELLTASLSLIEDISADVSGGVVKRDNLADVHGTVDLSISRALAWGRDRVRPFMLLSSMTAGVSGCRWNQGVYLLMTPDTALGESPRSWFCTGFDQLHLLQNHIGDSYSVAAGANVLAAVRAALIAAGVLAPILLDSTASAKTLATAMVWPQTSSDNPTWLQVVNDLLAAIGYRGIWCDWDGAFRSGPYVLPEQRPSEFDLLVGDLVVGIVAEQRKVSNDVWGIPNAWRFVMNGLTAAPVEGVSMYSPTNPDIGPSSLASLGRTVRGPVVYLDAVDYVSLVVQGDRIKAAAMRTTELIEVRLSPMPAAWHADRFIYSDPDLGADRQVLGRSWSLPLSGEGMSYVFEAV